MHSSKQMTVICQSFGHFCFDPTIVKVAEDKIDPASSTPNGGASVSN
jgi:hypothetical protein